WDRSVGAGTIPSVNALRFTGDSGQLGDVTPGVEGALIRPRPAAGNHVGLEDLQAGSSSVTSSRLRALMGAGFASFHSSRSFCMPSGSNSPVGCPTTTWLPEAKGSTR